MSVYPKLFCAFCGLVIEFVRKQSKYTDIIVHSANEIGPRTSLPNWIQRLKCSEWKKEKKNTSNDRTIIVKVQRNLIITFKTMEPNEIANEILWIALKSASCKYEHTNAFRFYLQNNFFFQCFDSRLFSVSIENYTRFSKEKQKK